MPSQPLRTRRLRQFPGRQAGRDRRALLQDRHGDRYTGIEHRLNRYIRISHYDRRLVSRIAIVLPGQQIPAFTGRRNVKYELSGRRHRAAFLTITAAGTSSASRLGPLVPVADGILSNADTPGVDPSGPLPAVPVDAVMIPSGVTVGTGAVEASAWSAIHSLSASATLIASNPPRTDICIDFTLIDSITKRPRYVPTPKISGSARCCAAVARNSANCTAGLVKDTCHISSKFSRCRSSPTHCILGLLSITRCSAKSYDPADS